MSKTTTTAIDRRDFFRKAGLGAGVAGAAAAGLSASKAGAAEPTKGGSKAGYRETAHVKKFYELARF
ncbi:MAG TPA: hypothetical protein VLL72_04165 [Kiloniellales bacterium]|nr:hypothetical protein [Kiloniellales bacterium]